MGKSKTGISPEQVWHPSYRAFLVYYVAIGVAVFGPLINPAVGVPPWLGFLLGLVVLAALLLRKFGQEYRATPRGLKRVGFWPAVEEEIPRLKLSGLLDEDTEKQHSNAA